MVATSDPSGNFHLDFTPIPDAIPPQNVDIEESVLGSLLLDPNCIHVIKNRLRPEHFYLPSHQHIYKACLSLAKKNVPCDLLAVTDYLLDKKQLAEVGGRAKLLSLLDVAVTSVNVDNHANLLIQKHTRRELIRLGNDINRFAYSGELDLEDVLEIVRRRAEKTIDTDALKDPETVIREKHDRLIDSLKHIYTTTTEPSLKYLKLKYLAEETRTSISFLENLYLKSLVGRCTQLMDYNDLKEAAGSSVRRWLQQGLIPLGSTILLAADGGVGKTKFVYSIAKNLITGNDFGNFLATGNKRKILFYQGDEQPGDMLQSLQMLGYEEGDINKHIRVRFGWSFENMATLIKDLNEFQPDFVLFDSMSFGQRFSSYKEGDSEFARPILECTGLAVQHNCTFLFIHHTNKGGDIRGTTATRNAVSEVWRLSKDNRPDATSYDRILEIDKSRSRSSGKKYRLYFDPDSLGFNFLGEEYQADEDKNTGIRDNLLRWFREHPNIKYTAEELSHLLHISGNSTRRTLNEMSSDGMISVERRPGKAYLYYLDFDDRGDQPPKVDHLLITSVDHLHNPDTASDTAKADQVINEIAPQKISESKNEIEKRRSVDQLRLEPLPAKESGGDQLGDQQVINGATPPPVGNNPLQSADQQSSTKIVHPPQKPLAPEPQRKRTTTPSPAGEIFGVAESFDGGKTWDLMWRYPVGKSQKEEKGFVGDDMEAMKRLGQVAKTTSSYWRYQVLAPDGKEIKRCKCIEMPNSRGVNKTNFIFETPDKQTITVTAGRFEWQPPRGN